MKHHAAMIVRNGNKVLFIQRATTKKVLPNIWAFPSGTVEEGETLEITAVREAKEELNIEIEIEKILGSVELNEFDSIVHFIVCTQKCEKPITCDLREIQAMEWLSFEEFFEKYDDSQIGHGLQYLRKHPKLYRDFK